MLYFESVDVFIRVLCRTLAPDHTHTYRERRLAHHKEENNRSTDERREENKQRGEERIQRHRVVWYLCTSTQILTLWPAREKNEQYPSLFVFFLFTKTRKGDSSVEWEDTRKIKNTNNTAIHDEYRERKEKSKKNVLNNDERVNRNVNDHVNMLRVWSKHVNWEDEGSWCWLFE